MRESRWVVGKESKCQCQPDKWGVRGGLQAVSIISLYHKWRNVSNQIADSTTVDRTRVARLRSIASLKFEVI
jgi:hypothetical protein